MIIERTKRIDFVMNFIIVVVCIVHISLTGYNVLFPDLPSIRIQDKSLKDIELPLLIQMCVSEIEKTDIFTHFGYDNEIEFYFGKSIYNDSLFGWNGHLPNGSTIGNIEGILRLVHIFVKNLCKISLDILTNVTSVLDQVLNSIEIHSNESTNRIVQSKSIKWGLVPDFILCRTIDLSKYFDLGTLVPEQIILKFNKMVNHGVSIYFTVKNKYMKRPLKVAMLDYSGPDITVEDLNSPMGQMIILSISQFIDSEQDRDKNCVNYPHGSFKSYAECDAKFVYDQFSSKYKPLMPFWVTDDINEVTSLR